MERQQNGRKRFHTRNYHLKMTQAPVIKAHSKMTEVKTCKVKLITTLNSKHPKQQIEQFSPALQLIDVAGPNERWRGNPSQGTPHSIIISGKEN